MTSFAFDTRAPVQRQSGLQAVAPRIGLTGGDNVSGTHSATQQTDFGGSSDLPAFIEQALAPQLQQRQQAAFTKGMAAAVSKQAVNDIRENTPAVSRIFGPSYYEQGAAFGYSQKAVNDGFNTLMNDPDLEKLSQDEVTAKVQAMSDGLQTNDPNANMLVQKGIMDGTMQFMDVYAKKAYTYRQKEGARAQSAMWVSGADGYDAYARANTGSSSDISEAAKQNFIGSLQQLPGQDDASYKKNLSSTAALMLQKGNFFSYNAAAKAGVFTALDPDQQDRLQSRAESLQNKAVRDVATNSQPVADAITAVTIKEEAYDTFLALTPEGQAAQQAKGYVPPTPDEIGKDLAGINQMIRTTSGVDADLFTYTDIAGGRDSIVKSLYRASTKQIEADKAAAQRHKEAFDDKAAEAAQKATDARMAWSQGRVGSGLLEGLYDQNQVDLMATQAWQSGGYKQIATVYDNDGANFNVGKVSAMARAPIAAAQGKGVTTGFGQALAAFDQMHEASTGAAMAIYGDDYAHMSTISSMVKAGFSVHDAFKTQYDKDLVASPIDFHTAARLDKSFDGVLSKFNPSTSVITGLFGGQKPLNDSAKVAVKSAAYRIVAQALPTSTVPDDVLLNGSIKRAINNHSLDMVGQFAWTQRAGSATMSEATKLPNDVLGNILPQYLDSQLKAKGFGKGADAPHWEITPMQSNGEVRWSFTAVDDSTGDEVTVAVKPSDLVQFKQAKDKAHLEGKNSFDAGLNRLIHGDPGATIYTGMNKSLYPDAKPAPKPLDVKGAAKAFGKAAEQSNSGMGLTPIF